MTGRSRTVQDFGGRAARLAAVKARLRDPAVLTIVAVAFIVSAVGQAIVQWYVQDNSIVATAVLSVFASVFLAAAIIVGARRHERETRDRRFSDKDVS